MVTVTLTQTENGGTIVNLSANVVYGTDFYDIRLNQSEQELVTGDTIVYDAGPTRVHGVLVMKNVSYTDGESLRAWISGNIKFAYNRFTIAPLSAVNLGNGKNTAVTNCRYDGKQSMADVFKYVAPGIYTINFPFRFLRSS